MILVPFRLLYAATCAYTQLNWYCSMKEKLPPGYLSSKERCNTCPIRRDFGQMESKKAYRGIAYVTVKEAQAARRADYVVLVKQE